MTRPACAALLALAIAGLVAWTWPGPGEDPAGDAGETVADARTDAITQEDRRNAPTVVGHDARGPQAVEVCGLGDAPLLADAATAGGGLAALPAATGDTLLAQVRKRLLAALRQDGRARARVAAQLLDPPDRDDPTAWHAWAQATLHAALAAPDPVALAWAEPACGRLIGAGDGDVGSACRRTLIRAQLRLEPDNARHWAALGEEDPAAADEAWQGLRQAQRWHEAPQALALITQQALPVDVPAYLRLALAAEIDARAAALPSPGDGFLMARCAEQAPGRQDECRALAERMATHGDTTQLLARALQLGRVAGWPEARQQAVQDELQALASEQVRWRPEASQPLSCRSVDTWLAQLQDMASVGELPALRRRLAANAGAVPMGRSMSP